MECVAPAQRVVSAFTGLPGDPGGVSIFSQDSRSAVSAAEHVGKHSEGIAGCLASAGTGGMAGGPAGSDELGDTLAQLASNSISGASISARLVGFLFRSIGNLRLSRDAALFFGASPVSGLDLIDRGRAPNLGYLGVLASGGELGPNQERQRERRHSGDDFHPRHSALSCSRRLTSPGSFTPLA